MDTDKENFQALMTQIKSGDEKIKEVDFIIVIKGNKKEIPTACDREIICCEYIDPEVSFNRTSFYHHNTKKT